MEHKKLENIIFDGEKLTILDQTLLPSEIKYIDIPDSHALYEAIKFLRVRGAPAIGIAAAYGYYIEAASNLKKGGAADFESRMESVRDLLISARPTAVNLSWAVNRMHNVMLKNKAQNADRLLETLRNEAITIHNDDKKNNLRISEYGLTLLKDGFGVLTHCNAGPLATSGYGTALGPLILGTERGMKFHVFADETRPLLQGARLTSLELMSANVDVTLICDSMANQVMKEGRINAVFTGADRIASNGDAANKIGTNSVAVLAGYYGIPFYMLAPLSTVDMNCVCGDDIVIEQRAPEEITQLHYKKRMAPENVKIYNPAFDVTPHELIKGIVTEEGIIHPPFNENLKAAFERAEKRKIENR